MEPAETWVVPSILRDIGKIIHGTASEDPAHAEPDTPAPRHENGAERKGVARKKSSARAGHAEVTWLSAEVKEFFDFLKSAGPNVQVSNIPVAGKSKNHVRYMYYHVVDKMQKILEKYYPHDVMFGNKTSELHAMMYAWYEYCAARNLNVRGIPPKDMVRGAADFLHQALERTK